MKEQSMTKEYKVSLLDRFVSIIFLGVLLLIWHILLHFHLLDMVR